MTPDELVAQVQQEVIDWRRHLHRNPELSFHEQDTARSVQEALWGGRGWGYGFSVDRA